MSQHAEVEARLDANVSRLRADLAAAVGAREAAEAETASLIDAIRAYDGGDAGDSGREVRAKDVAVDVLQSEVERLQGELKHGGTGGVWEGERAALETQLEYHRGIVDALQLANQALQKDRDGLAAELAATGPRAVAAESGQRDAQARVKALEVRVASLSAQLEAERDNAARSLAESRTVSEITGSNLRESLTAHSEAASNLAEANAAIASLEARAEAQRLELEAVKVAKASLGATMADLTAERDTARDEVARLEERLDEATALVSSLELDLKDARMKADHTVEAANDLAQRSQDELAALRDQHGRAVEEIEGQRATIEELSAALEEVEAQRQAEGKGAAAELATVQAELKQTQERESGLRSAMDDLHASAASMQDQLAKRTNESLLLTSLSADGAGSRRDVEDLQAQLRAQRDEHDRLMDVAAAETQRATAQLELFKVGCCC